MIIENTQSGFYFALEPHEFKACDWKSFFAQVKRFDGWEYDSDNKQWYIPNSARQAFALLRQEYIDNVIHKDQLKLL